MPSETVEKRTPHLSPPPIKELRRRQGIVEYLCLCGKKAKTDVWTWSRGIKECACNGRVQRFPMKNLMGLKVGRLTVTGWAGRAVHQEKHHWVTTCECGNVKVVAGSELTRRDRPTSSCGCLTIEWATSERRRQLIYKDLTGKRFGRLVAVKVVPSPNKGHNYHWLCQCDCGGSTVANGASLTNGTRVSCGCMRQERREPDITNVRFGHLVAKTLVQEAEYVMDQRWRCRCDCGKTVTLARMQLITANKTQSCGCRASGRLTPAHG